MTTGTIHLHKKTLEEKPLIRRVAKSVAIEINNVTIYLHNVSLEELMTELLAAPKPLTEKPIESL